MWIWRGSGLVFLSLVALALSAGPTMEDYRVYQQLEDALLNNSTGQFNLFTLRETFYPKIGSGPICMPVNYYLVCNDSCSSCVNCAGQGYNTSFLWTVYNLDAPIGPLLLSYAWNGIVLRGFDWEDACIFLEGIELTLELDCLDCDSESTVEEAQRKMTAALKGYAKHQGKPDPGDSSTQGYVDRWNDEDRETRVFHTSNVILTTMVIVLNVFIFFFAIGMTQYAYDNLYKNIKKKKNPGYPLFWAIAVLSILWNAGPSWLVLEEYGFQVLYSIVVMIILELLVAICVRKKANFPIPCMSRNGCAKHKGEYVSVNKMVVRCFRCAVSHLVQTVAIWSILVSFTFLVYYLSAIIIAFYLYPTQTLVKVVFLKAVAVCVILNVALVFSVSRFKFAANWKACKKNLTSVVMLIAVLMFLPILGFLAFVIGGILFSNSSQTTGLQAILTLVPALFLVVVAYVSRGHLFPEGINDTDAAKEIISDLEKGSTKPHTDDHQGASRSLSHASPLHIHTSPHSLTGSGELSNYNTLDSHTMHPMSFNGDPQEGERKPLLHT